MIIEFGWSLPENEKVVSIVFWINCGIEKIYAFLSLLLSFYLN